MSTRSYKQGGKQDNRPGDIEPSCRCDGMDGPRMGMSEGMRKEVCYRDAVVSETSVVCI